MDYSRKKIVAVQLLAGFIYAGFGYLFVRLITHFSARTGFDAFHFFVALGVLSGTLGVAIVILGQKRYEDEIKSINFEEIKRIKEKRTEQDVIAFMIKLEERIKKLEIDYKNDLTPWRIVLYSCMMSISISVTLLVLSSLFKLFQ